MRNRNAFLQGMHDGIPIALGYLAVSFTLGIAAVKAGLSPGASALMSITSVTSAGEFAGLGVIATGASLLEMALTQLIINLRYCLMSAALTQKLDPKTPFWHRFLLAQGVTDEIFGISIGIDGTLNPFYTYGAMLLALPGWTLGTWLGAVMGGILPARILSAMSVALYGMFIAVILPPARTNRILAGLVAIAMAASLAATRLPVVRDIRPGTRIILLTVLLAGVAAWLFPVSDQARDDRHQAESRNPAAAAACGAAAGKDAACSAAACSAAADKDAACGDATRGVSLQEVDHAV